jgi:hypothetical protein
MQTAAQQQATAVSSAAEQVALATSRFSKQQEAAA